MCDIGEDETVEHMVLECVKYARDRNEMMQVVQRELGKVRVKTGKEWIGWCCSWGCVGRRMKG